jgi:hypothetical protein
MRKSLLLILIISIIVCSIGVVNGQASEKAAKALVILENLGAKKPVVLDDNRDFIVKDNLVTEPDSIIEFNGGSYAFLDNQGSIVRIKRVEEIRKLKKQGLPSDSKYDNIDSLREYIEKDLVGSGYILTNQYYFTEDTLSLRYEKELFDGATNRYDYVSVRINVPLIELESFYRSSNEYNWEEDQTVISADEAIKSANAYFRELGEDIVAIKLTTFKPSSIFGKSVDDDSIHLVYIVSSEASVIYIDAYTAECIGTDIYKVVRGGSIGDDDMSTAYSSCSIAISAFVSMGYSNAALVMSTQFDADVPDILKTAFYCCCHGGYNSIGSNTKTNNAYHYYYASSVPSALYRFVFLDACNTASSDWKTAFNISNSSTNKAFLGWTSTVTTSDSFNFCLDFWAYVFSTYTIYEAASDAADVDIDKPIQFTGDTSYNGYFYW